MPLKLRVISDQYKQLGKASSQLFGVHGGNIGRAPDNDWVLPDPDRYVSSHHAKVAFRAGSWLLEDVSTNGVYVNDSDTPLSASGGTRKLKDGDRLRFGDYDIVVSIDDHSDFSADASGQMPPPSALREPPKARSAADQADYLRRGTFRNHQDNRSDHLSLDLGEELDITGLLVSGSREAQDAQDAVAAFDRGLREDAFDRGLREDAGFATHTKKPITGPSTQASTQASAQSSGKNTPRSSATASLLDNFLHEEEQPNVVTLGEANEDWHMNTRRLQQRKAAAGNAPLLQVVPTPTSPRDVVAPVLRANPPARAETPREVVRNDTVRVEPLRFETQKSESNGRRAPDSNSDFQSGVEALCRGAGIDPASIPSDAHASILSLAGQMVREVVLDLMEALRSRGDLKNRLNLLQTTIQPNQNNPLKLAASVEEALRKLLDANNTRNLGAVDALREAFTDLKNHQTAIDAGMNAALNDLLGRVDPTELQERFDRGLKRNAPQAAVNKGKYWDLYTEFYPLLNQRDNRGWPAVFTEEFTRAYATKVDDLESAKKK
jgi:type VI secretion system protein